MTDTRPASDIRPSGFRRRQHGVKDAAQIGAAHGRHGPAPNDAVPLPGNTLGLNAARLADVVTSGEHLAIGAQIGQHHQRARLGQRHGRARPGLGREGLLAGGA